MVLPVVVMVVGGSLDLSRFSYAADLAWGSAKVQTDVPRPADVAEIRTAALLEWLVPAALAVLLVALALRRPLPAAAITVAMGALLTLDLWRVGGNVNPVISRAEAAPASTPAIEYLRSRRPSRFVGAASGTWGALPPNLAMRYGLYDARGYDFPVDLRFGTFWDAGVNPLLPDSALRIPASISTATMRALRLLGVADVIQAPGAPPLTTPGLRVAQYGSDARVYAFAGALPRAFVVERQQAVEGADAALAAVLSPRFDPRAAAVTEAPVPGIRYGEGRAGPSDGSARITRYDDGSIEIRARTTRRSLLVLTDAYDPNWKAWVDEAPVQVQRVNYLLRGVPVERGRHRIEMRYEPSTWRWGRLVSLATLLALCIALTGSRWQPLLRRARRSRRDAARG